ncbi:unnamed protein product [Rhizophagus irregularis]|nr:unnamed protein product [Rhizophagus irregularis]
MLPIYLSTLSEISNNLDHLEIVNHNLCSEELRNFITVQNNLKELTIEAEQFIITTTSKVEDPCDIGLYINSISNNCPSLTIFKGVISEINVLELSQLLKNALI